MTLEEYTCGLFACTIDEIHGKSRLSPIVSARQVCMAAMRDFARMSYREIGMCFDKGHPTVISSIRTVRNLYDTERNFREKVDKIYAACSSGEVYVPQSFEAFANNKKYYVADDCGYYIDEDMKLYASLV